MHPLMVSQLLSSLTCVVISVVLRMTGFLSGRVKWLLHLSQSRHTHHLPLAGTVRSPPPLTTVSNCACAFYSCSFLNVCAPGNCYLVELHVLCLPLLLSPFSLSLLSFSLPSLSAFSLSLSLSLDCFLYDLCNSCCVKHTCCFWVLVVHLHSLTLSVLYTRFFSTLTFCVEFPSTLWVIWSPMSVWEHFTLCSLWPWSLLVGWNFLWSSEWVHVHYFLLLAMFVGKCAIAHVLALSDNLTALLPFMEPKGQLCVECVKLVCTCVCVCVPFVCGMRRWERCWTSLLSASNSQF